ncbi:DUF3833 domain-containing protein [Cochlodiniinecator piscidefendens]|uniref:DUF3833 domain-containing protein n=1 Tax=Cochlodiniinecator piscidefendens TaxID=2715756 RepID=UPI00140C133F|nr:DUF3833 domain-containing protein [Cochlodiniinecator piscidefendens]
MKLLTLALFAILLLVAARGVFFSFGAQKPTDYAENGPAFTLKEHLSGPILSEGVIYGPTGRVTNSFTAHMQGNWEGDTGTLTESFTYSNGQTQEREWTLTAGADNTFTATAEDIIGAAQGVVSGSTIMMTYEIVLPERAGGHVLSVTDWLYLTESGVIINRSEMRKFGIMVAELVATMRPATTSP